jgi:adhesin/invasin
MLACGSSGETAADVLIIAALTGASQNGTVGQAVTTPPAVKVTKNGNPDAGVSVTFAITSGGGTVSGATQTTGADGVARVGSWTLGTAAGSNTVTATATGISGSPLSFTATGAAGPAMTLVKAGGDAQSSAAGVPVSTKPSVKATDSFGNAASGVPVTFAAASGGGSISAGSQTTGADGTATVGGWTLGQLVGANTLTATAAGLSGSPLTFTATGTAGPIASLLKVAGDSQSAVIGTALLIAPSVRAADQFGNLIASQSVAFAVGTGGGAIAGATASTGANGVATVGSWTLGPAIGANTLNATASTFTIVFTATGLAAGFNAAPYAGTYHGTWTNTTFSSVGTANAVVTVNTANSTASVTVNVTGSVLGSGSGVSNVVESGTYTANGVTFSGNVPPMGNMTVTGVAGASSVAVTASGVSVPNPAISRWDATGTLTPTALQLNFTVTFTSGPPAVGTISLAKP